MARSLFTFFFSFFRRDIKPRQRRNPFLSFVSSTFLRRSKELRFLNGIIDGASYQVIPRPGQATS